MRLAHEPPQHRLPALWLMSERRHGDRRLKEPGERRLARLKGPAYEPPHAGSLAVVRLLLHDEQRDVECRREIDRRELSGARLDERKVSAPKRVLEPPIVAPLDRHEHMFACSLDEARRERKAEAASAGLVSWLVGWLEKRDEAVDREDPEGKNTHADQQVGGQAKSVVAEALPACCLTRSSSSS
jgi:hypothetical protein